MRYCTELSQSRDAPPSGQRYDAGGSGFTLTSSMKRRAAGAGAEAGAAMPSTAASEFCVDWIANR